MQCDKRIWMGFNQKSTPLRQCEHEAEYITGDPDGGYNVRCAGHMDDHLVWTRIDYEPGQSMLADYTVAILTDRAFIPF